MDNAFIGEIRAFGFDFVPRGWMPCDGKTYPYQQFQALFAVIGNTYGGSVSQGTFAVPDLRGQIANGQGLSSVSGENYAVGNKGGVEGVTLTSAEIPSHKHKLNGAIAAQPIAQAVKVPALTTYLSNIGSQTDNNRTGLAYGHDTNPNDNIALGTSTISPVGGGQSHTNMAPYLALTYCICYDGVYPVKG